MKHYKFVLLLLLMGSMGCQGETFKEFIERVEYAEPAQQQTLVDSFYAAHPRLPFCETDSTVHFIYRGSAISVQVAGDATEWSPTPAPLRRLGSTNLWYRSDTYEADARLDYKLVINGTSWILDPRNPYTCAGGFGANSELRMPRYVAPPGVIYQSNIPHGSVRDTILTSAILKNTRHIRIYTPPEYSHSTASYPLVVFHDGMDYLSLASANNILDYLIAERRIPPLIAVFVPPYSAAERASEYAGPKSMPFAAFIVEEVMGYVDRRYRTRKDPASRGLVGASNGGNISLLIGFHYPQSFALIAAQSSNVDSSLYNAYRDADRKELRLYLDLGTYDLAVLKQRVGRFVPLIAQKGYDYHYQEVHEGHSWGNWKGHLDDALAFLFRDYALGVERDNHTPGDFQLGQNYPNPFNPETIIPFLLARDMDIQLTVYDALGREALQLCSGRMRAGAHRVRFMAANLASGTYWCRLQGGTISQVKSMLLLH